MTPKYRAISAFEFLLGAFIVIGHNVFRILPNEVPILFVLGLVSVRLRDGRFSEIGFKLPESWGRILLIALAAAGLRILLGDLVIGPLTAKFWPAPIAPAHANEITGNPRAAAIGLVIVWTFAAFGEEIGYRGYLVKRGSDAFGGSSAANWIAVFGVSILFGFGHYYKGASGILDSGVAGLILGIAFIVSGRNLWAAILAHGFIDTFAVIAAFFGSDL